MTNNFDHIAPAYDILSKAVFGGAILTSQLTFLDRLAQNDAVLIVGGGTGELISYLPPVSRVDFVEKSARMLKRARKRRTQNAIRFFERDFFEFEPTTKYDAILCPFFLDCFDQEGLGKVLGLIQRYLKSAGHLFVQDFDSDTLPPVINRLLHLFFRLTVRLEASTLLNIQENIFAHNFSLLEQKEMHQKMIFTSVYRNP
ncbi:MAG: class I SAM-dependent methyltransferase [Bacteroidota bacterium]